MVHRAACGLTWLESGILCGMQEVLQPSPRASIRQANLLVTLQVSLPGYVYRRVLDCYLR